LAEHFAAVCATDASAEQLAHAAPHARVSYVRARAEACPLAPGSVELVTVAQALHWLDLEAFHAEVRRVLRPGGLLAAWCYDLVTSGDARIDACIRELYTGVLGPYWPPERRDVEEGYARLAFPYERLSVPQFEMHVSWSFEPFVGYAQTWSAAEAYRRAHGFDAVLTWAARTAPLWGTGERRLRWPLALHVGRNA
jgi:ubiquinone/menaquinone biosynthesis C-methylase UbiE